MSAAMTAGRHNGQLDSNGSKSDYQAYYHGFMETHGDQVDGSCDTETGRYDLYDCIQNLRGQVMQ